jgi:hypothetical protein
MPKSRRFSPPPTGGVQLVRDPTSGRMALPPACNHPRALRHGARVGDSLSPRAGDMFFGPETSPHTVPVNSAPRAVPSRRSVVTHFMPHVLERLACVASWSRAPPARGAAAGACGRRLQRDRAERSSSMSARSACAPDPSARVLECRVVEAAERGFSEGFLPGPAPTLRRVGVVWPTSRALTRRSRADLAG